MKSKQHKALWFRTPNPTPVPKVRKKLSRTSTAGAKRSRNYRKAITIWKLLPENQRCRRCAKTATDRHHTRGRTGYLLLNELYWVQVYRSCHDWIAGNPAQARKAGLLCGVGEWARI